MQLWYLIGFLVSVSLYFQFFLITTKASRNTFIYFLAACYPLLKSPALMKTVYYASKWGWVLVSNPVNWVPQGPLVPNEIWGLEVERNCTLKLNAHMASPGNTDWFSGECWVPKEIRSWFENMKFVMLVCMVWVSPLMSWRCHDSGNGGVGRWSWGLPSAV